jgi:peptidyl-prolyl cis-trans isomerase A (cyclophilin A)
MKTTLFVLLCVSWQLALATCPDEQVYPNNTYPEITFETSKGSFVIELDRNRAPITVNHFLRLVKEKAYDNNLFHRVVADYVIQSGAFKADWSDVKSCGNIYNESGNGLSNDRATIAMARYDDPHSASSSFYINVKDNPNLNPNKKSWGYTVFGYVVSGMDVVNQIAQVQTGYNAEQDAQNVPVEPIKIITVRVNE